MIALLVTGDRARGFDRLGTAGVLWLLAALLPCCRPSLPGDLPGLIQALGDNDMRIQFAATEDIAERYGQAGLEKALETGNPTARARAAQFLGLRYGAAALDSLLKASKDPEPHVRRWAVIALKKLSSPSAESRVQEMRADPDKGVASEAQASDK